MKAPLSTPARRSHPSLPKLACLLLIPVLLLGCLFVLGGSAGTALAAPSVLYVKHDATGANNGSSWTDAYTDLQSALGVAKADDEIWVAAGTYKPTSGTDRTVAFVLKAGVELYGGFAGTETARDERNWEANVTTLSGEIGDTSVTTDNSYHVVHCSNHLNVTARAILDGFTITGGRADGSSTPVDLDYSLGGGMYNFNSSPIVRNVVFVSNFAGLGGGGGMANRTDSSPTLVNVAFINNEARYDGGGMYNHTRCSPELTDVVFHDNRISWGGSGGGGGMYSFFRCSPKLTRVSFTGNTVPGTGSGGGIYAYNECSLDLVDVVFSGNSTIAHGGAIRLVGGSAVLRGVTFRENTQGALFASGDATLSITNTIFRGNSNNGSYGGAMRVADSTATITNTAFSNNTVVVPTGEASHGGAVYSDRSALTFTNVTFAGNVAGWSGGALYNTHSSPTLVNCILWGNSASYSGFQIRDVDSSTSTVSYSIVQGGWTGTGNLDADPKFVDAPNGDLRLAAVSPAIDACPSGPQSDLAGVSRPRGGGYDMGAYEYVGDILYVKHDATGANDGSSWADAYTQLQTALAAAMPGDEIWVARGTYVPGTLIGDSFTLRDRIGLYGGFAGTETARSQRDWKTNLTTLSGGGVSYHVVYASSVNRTIFDGFTVTGGNAAGTSPPANMGGGMYNYMSSPLIRNVVFSGNSAGWGGGGMYNYDGSSPTLVDVAFENNQAQFDGGGMYNHDRSSPTLTDVVFRENVVDLPYSVGGGGMGNFLLCSPTLTRVTFVDNTASGNGSGGGISAENQCSLTMDEVSFSGNSAGNGGAMRLYDRVTAVLRDVTFTANTASSSGGALYASANCSLGITDTVFDGHSAYDGGAMRVDNSSTTLTDVAFRDNTASGPDGDPSGSGGGLHQYMGTAALSNVTFSGNSAGAGGGGMFLAGSSPALSNVTFTGNSALGMGGGFYLNGSSPTLKNVTFTGNSAMFGGGMCNSASSPALTNAVFHGNSAGVDGGGMANYVSSPTLTNVTFSGNSASGEGGGMHNYNSSSPTLTNCIVWGNSASLGPEVRNDDATATITYSIVKMASGAYPGTGNLNADPRFEDAAAGDLRLRPGSPAIDAGNNDAPGLSGIDKDIRGYPRIFDGNGDGIAVVDMGAYEAEAGDGTPPEVTPPADKTVEATSSAGASVSFQATATDDVDGTLPVSAISYYLAYGTAGQTQITSPHLFPLGETTVTCAATDSSGNKGTATFKVTVKDTTPPQVSGFSVSPASPVAGDAVTIRATATDLASLIAAAEYRLGDGTWKPMPASDGAFDSQSEQVQVTLSGLKAGFYTVFVRATDSASPPNSSSGSASLGFWVESAPLPTFTLTYLAGEGGTISGKTPQEVEFGKKGSEVTAVPNQGYEFVCWSCGLTTPSRTDSFINKDLTVTAEFRLIATPPQPPSGDRWSDITDAQWMSYYGLKVEDVARVADGYPDGTFRPFLPITRAQFAKMALAGLGLSTHQPATAAYKDVPTTHQYFIWIEGARKEGLIAGYTDGTFRPGALITRQQASTILGRYLVKKELAASGHLEGSLGTYPSLDAWYAAEGGSVLSPFTDSSKLASVHAPYTAYLVYRGVILGSSSGGKLYLTPLADLVRAQAVALILRRDGLD